MFEVRHIGHCYGGTRFYFCAHVSIYDKVSPYATLQLISACRLGFWLVLRHLPSRLPLQRAKSLRQNRVRKVVVCVHPIRVHRTQVLYLQLDKTLGKLCLVSELLCKGIGLEFVFTAQYVHKQLNENIHRSEDIGKEDEADNDGVLLMEAKRFIE